MNKKIIKKYITENPEKLPLGYRDLTFKDFKKDTTNYKVVNSKKYNDSDYTIVNFYKEISRF